MKFDAEQGWVICSWGFDCGYWPWGFSGHHQVASYGAEVIISGEKVEAEEDIPQNLNLKKLI